jgi:DNA-directed RNA polymerase II subunit RPB9
MALVPASSVAAKGAVRLRFCKESNDLLYPREDKLRGCLIFACRNCDYQEDAGEEAEDNCVYRHIIDHTAAEKTVILADVRADPTLPRTRETTCPKEGCGHKEAVFFSSITAEGMTLFYQCMACSHRWNDVV